MIRLCIAFIDGTFVDEEFPDHEIEAIELMIEETPKELLCRVELEDRKKTLIYTYKRKPDYAY
jgi:hypothetical protein